MKLEIIALLCASGSAFAFVQKPFQRIPAKTALHMESDADLEDRREFVTKVSYRNMQSLPLVAATKEACCNDCVVKATPACLTWASFPFEFDQCVL